ncbi:hypothetical protein [Nostoc sp. UHCC 0870]|uniref:hypothetical protein n=1 Tax=Nostoc sp. UHCC 0870 TaxID=2914041 RepID=UPI001EDF113D|nr:hypothetical protein [Nostoc sp. UHCC 0870]UKO99352.1 hypothetical protein L6494_06465 [Nostoc sp. UHCC 0870]
MSQILGTLLDSAGFPLTGKLRVSLTGTLVNDIDTPDSINLTKPHLFDIEDGEIDIDLDESETSKVTYRFEFFETDVDDNLIEPALLDFYALVPNLSPIQFASLTPTGMVNDVLDTGALRVARIISANPNLAANIGGPFPKGNWSAGTTYIYRDLVNYLNRTYISKSITPITGVLPTDTNYWMNIPVEPNGTLILGDDTPYGVAWSDSGLATSQDAVYDAIQTVNSSIALKANLISPTFTGNVIVPNQAANTNNTRAANTAYVDAGLVLKANLDGSNLTNTTATTPASTDDSTKLATTAFVQHSSRPAFNVVMSVNQSSSADNLLVNFTTEFMDSDNTWNTNTFTVPIAGFYMFGGSLYLLNNDTSTRVIGAEIHINGTPSRRVSEAYLLPSVGSHTTITPHMFYLNVGDTLRIICRTFGTSFPYSVIANGGSGTLWGFRLPI